MAITEDRVEDMLRNIVFTDSVHRDAVRDMLRSDNCELSMDELELVAGGISFPEFHLIDNIFDE